MGCVATKTAAHATPAFNSSGASGSLGSSGEFAPSSSLWNRPQLGSYEFGDRSESGESGKRSSSGNSSVSFRMWNLNRQVEGEQVAAGWPAWLSSVAGEAIQGWVPLKADSFEKLEKIGQGTYSSVFRAREIDTGRIVALKKVRFDNFEPESVRFMAREIQILRRLDHPNIIKLEGLITSRLSSTIYLVFEYMEHDLAGLSSCPDIKLTEPQIKCYMHQLFTGLEQCHSHGIIHRDIKCANLLVNNNGTLKIADFGLANIWSPEEKQQLTSRVVTLWYRPPELLLGSTHYEPSVDLWSAGCVFAELFTGKPVLQGRTEVEQIHKILKLCGSPPEEFWKNSRLPHATVFKLQQPHGTTLQETFGYLPNSAFKLLETLLSIDPNHRGTASSALASEYFRTKPYACDPSSLPKYQPNKEIDVKLRAGSHRRSISGRSHVIEAKRRPSISQKSSRESNNLIKTASHREARNAEGMNRSSRKQELPVTADTRTADLQPKSNIALGDEGRRFKQISRRDHTFSGPLHGPSSSASFVWAKKPKEGLSRIKSSATPRSRQDKSGTLDLSNTSHAKSIFKWSEERNEDRGHSAYSNLNGPVPYESIKDAMLKQWMYPELQESVYTFGVFHSRDMSEGIHVQDTETTDTKRLGYQELREKVEFSGPLLQPHKVDKFLERHEQRIRKAVRKSWFQRGQRQGH